MTIETGDSVTMEYTGRLEDGTVFDTSRASVAKETGIADAAPDREYEPLVFEVGADQVIDGMEEGIAGLEAGEETTLTIPPEKAYGERSEENVQEYETDHLTEMLDGQTPTEGAYLEAQNGQQGEVVHVDDEHVRVDFNPQLAGETLEFDVEIISVE